MSGTLQKSVQGFFFSSRHLLSSLRDTVQVKRRRETQRLSFFSFSIIGVKSRTASSSSSFSALCESIFHATILPYVGLVPVAGGAPGMDDGAGASSAERCVITRANEVGQKFSFSTFFPLSFSFPFRFTAEAKRTKEVVVVVW